VCADIASIFGDKRADRPDLVCPSNACKFTKQGEVALRVRKVADGLDWVELTVLPLIPLKPTGTWGAGGVTAGALWARRQSLGILVMLTFTAVMDAHVWEETMFLLARYTVAAVRARLKTRP
jgi:hypothetical protein